MKMANKAGFVTTGFEKVKQCLADSPNVMLLLSEDTSEASISKLHLRHKPIAFMHKVSIMLLTSVFGSGLVKFIAIAPSSLCDRIEQGLIGCSILEKMRAQEALNVPKKSP
jgi:hypothetical protein